MSNWTFKNDIGPGDEVTYGASAAYTQLENVNAPASTNTKSIWYEMVASTTRDAHGFYFDYRQWLELYEQFIWDIAIGPGGSEEIIVENFPTSKGKDGLHSNFGPFWIPIPQGSRIAVRIQCGKRVGDSANSKAGIRLFRAGGPDKPVWTKVEAIGVNLASTTGVYASARYWLYATGTVAEVEGSTTKDYAGFFVTPTTDSGVFSDIRMSFNLGLGAGGSEKTFARLSMAYDNGGNAVRQKPMVVNQPAPEGSRISFNVAGTTGAGHRAYLNVMGIVA